MRVIAGLYRHRELKMPKTDLTRPTKDMVKGGIFNALGVKVNDAMVLDLFAGSGALGIEAISRGAKFAYFVDSSLDAKETILTNLNNLKIKNYQLVVADYLKALDVLSQQKVKIDILLLDPPYNVTDYETIINNANSLLNKNAVIVVESEKSINIKSTYQKVKEYRYGRTLVTLLWK